MNQIILVGRVVNLEDIKEKTILTIAIPRPYKNEEGLYDTDFIKVSLYNNLAINTKEYCQKGDLIGIKGMAQSIQKEKEYINEIVADKVTYLSAVKKGDI